MNTTDLTYLLNKPYSVNEKQTSELEAVLREFPYLQGARAIHLKGLYNQDSFRYNAELKKTAAYTTDRSVLFDFITSDQFQSIGKSHFEETEKKTAEIIVNDSEIVQPPVNKLEESIKQTIKVTGPETVLPDNKDSVAVENPVIMTEQPSENPMAVTEEKLEIGKPLEFIKNEKHSFQEWLQLSKIAPVIRESEPEQPEIAPEKTWQHDVIDKFIETNPKIVPVRNAPQPPANIDKNPQDTSYLMTETLARVYLEQKKYQKAIQAYQILILKYPEKSVFFADRISDIKTLQQNNN